MKKIYETKVTSIGGREGEVFSPDRSFAFKTTAPGKRVENATNPEQLFAAAYSACFNGALGLVMENAGETYPSEVSARVSLMSDEVEGFSVAVTLEVHLEGATKEKAEELEAEELVAAAHQVCPYSKATRNNIDVQFEII